MRINIYSQELTNEVEMFDKKSDTEFTYTAVRLFLHSSPALHHNAIDDDRSAITFWLPKSHHRREMLAAAFRRMSDLVLSAPPETGCD
jgi:hypothetical protein